MLPGKRGLGAAAAVKEAPRTVVWKALGFWPLLSGQNSLVMVRFLFLLLATFEVVITDAATTDGFFGNYISIKPQFS